MAELAGLILGGFPLVISALEHYKDGFQPLQEWWAFEREFSNFIEELGTQRARFDMNLEKLLTPFVTSDAEMNRLLDEGNPESWQDARLQKEIRSRLGKSHDWYCAICRKMNATLRDLQRRLGILGGQVKHADRSWWEHELRRLRISFSRKKFKHVKLLSKYNDELRELLSAGDELAYTRRHRQRRPLIDLVRLLQQHSQQLYSGLLSRWQCKSSQQHEAKLQLRQLFAQDGIGNQKLHLFLGACSLQKRVEVWIASEPSLATKQLVEPASFQQGLLELRQQVHERQPIANSISAKLATKMYGMKVGGISSIRSTKSLDDSQNVAPRQMLKKPKNKAHFAVPPAPLMDITHTSQQNPNVQEIKDFCSEMPSWAATNGCLGFIPSSQNTRLLFYADDSCTDLPDGCKTVTLEDLVPSAASTSEQVMCMTRKQRFIISNAVASAILQLQSTCWMSLRLEKRDIAFFVSAKSQQPVFSHPYISSIPGISRLNPPAVSVHECRKALFYLGVLLLELTFNLRMDTLPLRRNYLGPDGLPNEYTDLCTAKTWHRGIADECGEVLAEAIGCCIDCNFGIKPDWNSEEFVEAYIDKVLEPLRAVLRQFEASV